MTTPVNPPRRADELEPGWTVAVSGTSTLTVAATRREENGDIDIRWEGSTLWATVPAGREFTVIEEEVP
ncbi:hypothetical protein ACQP2Y_21150 [Actinoplanes sp. CA-051413]|uniref:hypothetical protein n=1 Tax=Actinoplanes sp. CA-051413 TaxID=3239899 RepID=UPI003D9814FC